jgi:hypothetical protein
MRLATANLIVRRGSFLLVTALLSAAWPMADRAYGQGMGSTKRSDGAYRSIMLGLPLASSERGPVARLELNLFGKGSIAIEGSSKQLDEDLTKTQVAQTGESMMSKGGQASLLFFQYSKPAAMAGWYYGGGVGFHEDTISWHRRTSDAGVALADASFTNHYASLKGPTGHVRGGYRYVGTEIPMLVGAYFGLKHFQATANDAQPEDVVAGTPAPTPMSAADKDHLLDLNRTAAEIGIEIGFVL